MGALTGIEWTDATWNPVVGCSHCSPGCDNCYAAREAAGRLSANATYAGLSVRNAAGVPMFTGEVRLLRERLEQPLRWRRPRRIFVNSMSDLFHPDVPSNFVCEVFELMGRAHWHTFQVLTKRPQRMESLVSLNLPDAATALPNVWLGTSVENQRYADLRIPHLLATPAVVRFLSIEPLLGPVDLSPWLDRVDACPTCNGSASVPVPGGGKACPDCFDDPNGQGARTTRLIDWVIVGGESGPRARPMHPEWVRSIRDQCVAARVPFLFKQWTGSRPKLLGRELDGREWNEYPS